MRQERDELRVPRTLHWESPGRVQQRLGETEAARLPEIQDQRGAGASLEKLFLQPRGALRNVMPQ